MATRKKKTIIEEVLPEDNGMIDGIGNPVSEELSLAAYYKIFKVYPSNKRAFCFQSDVPVDESTIQQRYPDGGQFIVEDYTVDGTLLSPKTVYHIEPEPLKHNLNPQSNNSNSDFQTRFLMDELNHQRALVRDLIASKNNGGSSLTELTAALANLKEIAGDGPTMMDVLMKGMDLGAKAVGVKINGDETPDWKTTIADGIKQIALPVVSALATQRAQPAQTVAALPAANTEQQETPEMMERLMMQQGLKWIKNQIISANLNPDLAVEWMLQNANDPMYRPFIVKAAGESIDYFIELDAEIRNEPFRTWFSNVIQQVKDAYAEQQSNDNAGHVGGNGDGSNASNDAAVGVTKSKLSKVV